MRVLVSGGAGYIGSHTVVQLVSAGHDVVIVDDFSNAKPSVVGRLEALTGRSIPVHAFDLADVDKTERFFATEQVDAVIHFAGFKAVGESVAKPLDYYQNNLGTTFSLLRAMERHGVYTLVFSSSATVYGADPELPMTEDLPTSATNPYGWTKVMIEQILRDVAASSERWRIAALRYFNPVGAHPSGQIGEDPSGIPNNLMPFVAQVAVGRREKLSVYGDDYDTPDGTCVRDYIHVADLADAHLLALDAAVAGEHLICNLGNGNGFSVREVIETVRKVTGHPIPEVVAPRRGGDPAVLVASARTATDRLGWQPKRADLAGIVADAWAFAQKIQQQ